MPKPADLRHQFRALHASGTFVMPNPHDVGTTKLLTAVGFPALATTSAGFASTLGRVDMTVSLEELAAHVERLVAATHVPFNVDGERLYGADPAGVADAVHRLAAAGAAGCSIEDWDPTNGRIDDLAVSVERVGAAAEAARSHAMVLTARCEHHIRGVDDLPATIDRLIAYRDAGAEVVYAPGLVDIDRIRHVVDAVGIAVNVLMLPGGPSVGELSGAGVRRVSLGGHLAHLANAAVVQAAQQLLRDGTINPPDLDRALVRAAFSA